MSADGPPGGKEQASSIQTDDFWPAFWAIICRYSEYFYMLLMLLTVFAVLNAIGMLLAEQSTGAFVIAVLVFVILGVTGLGVALVLYQCNKMKR